MYKINDAETQRILEGLKETVNGVEVPVTLEQFNSKLLRSGVLVDIKAGRDRLYFSIDLDSFGVNVEQLQTKDFVRAHIDTGKLSVIPRELDKKLNSLYDKARYAKKKLAVFGEEYILADSIPELKKTFIECKEEYFRVRDEIVSSWFNIIGDFESSLWQMLDELNVGEKQEAIFKSVTSKIPKVEDYEKSFFFDMSIKAFPCVMEVPGFDPGLNEDILMGMEDEILSTAYAAVAKCLNDVVSVSNKIIAQYDDTGLITGNTKRGLEPLVKQLKNRNVFKNPEITEIAEQLEKAIEADDDDLAAVAEAIEGKVYRYSKEVGIELSVKPILPVAMLKIL